MKSCLPCKLRERWRNAACSVNYNKEQKKGILKKSLTTSAISQENQVTDTKSKENTNSMKTTTQTCLFCDVKHSIDTCVSLTAKDFLKKRGLCFGCLKQGQLSKFCIGKVSSQVCSLTHPTLLPIKKGTSVVFVNENYDEISSLKNINHVT